MAESMAREETILHLFGSASTELVLDDILDAKSMPPNCPMPSLRIQLRVAGMGAACSWPTPIARRRVWVDSTMVAVDAVLAMKEYIV